MVKAAERFAAAPASDPLRDPASGLAAVPRLSVFRSGRHIYAQVIDDAQGVTLAAASTLDKTLRGELKTGADSEAAKRVGLLLAERAKAAGIETVVFDRGGYRVSRSGEGPGRRRPRGRPVVLISARRTAMARRRGDERTDEIAASGELIDRLVSINRVAKVVKGGRRFGFSALVVVGDGKGRVGYGSGKAREVPEAVRKATEQAKRGMIRVPLRQGRTLHHDIDGHFGAGRVLLRSAPPGTGIIAGGPMRAVFEALGIGDVVAKSLGSTQPAQHGQGDLRGAGPRWRARARSPPSAARRSRDLVGRREAVEAAAKAE